MKPSRPAGGGDRLLLAAALVAALPGSLLRGGVDPSPADELAAGERVYVRRCAACHGPAGEGGRGSALAVPRLVRAPDEASLLTVIRKGIEGTEMPGLRLSDAETLQLARWVMRLGERPVEPSPGDASRGEPLYLGKGGCVACHAIGGRGGAFGPDLTDIGRRRGVAHLRASLTDPEADVPRSRSMYRSDVSVTQNFLQVRVVTRSGRRMLGVRVNEDTFSLQLRDASGRLHSFFKDELVDLQKDWGRSPMPAYGRLFTEQELDDLVAYLLSLSGE